MKKIIETREIDKKKIISYHKGRVKQTFWIGDKCEIKTKEYCITGVINSIDIDNNSFSVKTKNGTLINIFCNTMIDIALEKGPSNKKEKSLQILKELNAY